MGPFSLPGSLLSPPFMSFFPPFHGKYPLNHSLMYFMNHSLTYIACICNVPDSVRDKVKAVKQMKIRPCGGQAHTLALFQGLSVTELPSPIVL